MFYVPAAHGVLWCAHIPADYSAAERPNRHPSSIGIPKSVGFLDVAPTSDANNVPLRASFQVVTKLKLSDVLRFVRYPCVWRFTEREP